MWSLLKDSKKLNQLKNVMIHVKPARYKLNSAKPKKGKSVDFKNKVLYNIVTMILMVFVHYIYNMHKYP